VVSHGVIVRGEGAREAREEQARERGQREEEEEEEAAASARRARHQYYYSSKYINTLCADSSKIINI
jgi:hypothetical protein